MTAAIAAIAGADSSRVLLLGGSMLLVQLGIGAANDWADAPADGLARPDKPIPAGQVSRPAAAGIALTAGAAGLALAAVAGGVVLAIAALGLLAGLAYDLRLKGTRWSWVPYALGVPLLPLFGWVGATGAVPPAFAVLLPCALVAGAALAVANALADVERDRVAGVETVATTLGIVTARRVGAILQAVVVGVAVASALALGGDSRWVALAVVGGGIVVVGLRLGWDSGRDARQRAWEVQAFGLAVLAAGWVGALAAAGRLAG